MLKENNKVLKCSNASPDWRAYVDFVNNVVVDGMSRVICASLEYLLDQVCRWYLREARLLRRAYVNDKCASLQWKVPSSPCMGETRVYHIIDG